MLIRVASPLWSTRDCACNKTLVLYKSLAFPVLFDLVGASYMVNDECRLYLASLLQAKTTERQMQSVFLASAFYFERTLKGQPPSVFVMQRVLEEFGCLALAELGSKLKFWLKHKYPQHLHGDAATSGDQELQTLGTGRAVFNDKGEVDHFERLMFGIQKLYSHKSDRVINVCKYLIRDPIDAYNFIYGGDEGLNDSDDEDDVREATGGSACYNAPQGMIGVDEDSEDERELEDANEKPGGEYDHQDREGLLDLRSVLQGFMSCVSDHGEHVMWKELVPWINDVAGMRKEIRKALGILQLRVGEVGVEQEVAFERGVKWDKKCPISHDLDHKGRKVCWPDRLRPCDAHLDNDANLDEGRQRWAEQPLKFSTHEDVAYDSGHFNTMSTWYTNKPLHRVQKKPILPTHIRKLIMQLAFKEELEFVFLSRKGFFCWYHKLAKGTEKGMARIALLENKLRIQIGTDKHNTNLSAENGSFTCAVILSITKLVGRTQYHDETISKGKLAGGVRDHTGHQKIHFARILGSRGDMSMLDAALGCLRIMRDQSGRYNLEGLVKAFCGKCDTQLPRALLYATNDLIVDATLKVFIFLFFVVVHPFHKYVEHPASSQYDMREASDQYRKALVTLQDYRGDSLKGEPHWWLQSDTYGKTCMMELSYHVRVLGKDSQERRDLALTYVYADFGDTESVRKRQCKYQVLLMNEAAKGFLESLDSLTSEKWGGEMLKARPGSRLEHRSKHVPSSTSETEGFVGTVSNVRGRNKNQKIRNLSFQVLMGEVNVCGKARMLLQERPRKFYRTMARCREYRKILLPRMKRRDKAQKEEKIRELDAYLYNSDRLRRLREEKATGFEDFMRSWATILVRATRATSRRRHGEHTFPVHAGLPVYKEFLQGLLLAKFGGFDEESVRDGDESRKYMHRVMLSFANVHKVHKIARKRGNEEVLQGYYARKCEGKCKGKDKGMCKGKLELGKCKGNLKCEGNHACGSQNKMKLSLKVLMHNVSVSSRYFLINGSPNAWEHEGDMYEILAPVLACYDVNKPWGSGVVCCIGVEATASLYNIAWDDDEPLAVSVPAVRIIAKDEVRQTRVQLDEEHEDFLKTNEGVAGMRGAKKYKEECARGELESVQAAHARAATHASKQGRAQGLQRARAAKKPTKKKPKGKPKDQTNKAKKSKKKKATPRRDQRTTGQPQAGRVQEPTRPRSGREKRTKTTFDPAQAAEDQKALEKAAKDAKDAKGGGKRKRGGRASREQ